MLEKTSGNSRGEVGGKDAADRLRRLGVDPIDELVSQLDSINEAIDKESSSESPRSQYLTTLLGLRLRIVEALLPYKYGKVPANTGNESDSDEPVTIILDMKPHAPTLPSPPNTRTDE